MDPSALLIRFMVGILYPAWLVAGFIDYACHRRTHIATTSGLTESALHLAQFAVLAVALGIALFLQITTSTFIILFILVFAHSTLAFIDVRYTDGLRRISPLEQLAHEFLDVLPLVAIGILAILNWELIVSPTWSLRVKEIPISMTLAVSLFASFLLLPGLLALEELYRVWRRQRARITSASRP